MMALPNQTPSGSSLAALGPLPTLPQRSPPGMTGVTSPPPAALHISTNTSLAGAPTNLRSPRESSVTNSPFATAGTDPMPRRKASLTGEVLLPKNAMLGNLRGPSSNAGDSPPNSGRKPPVRLDSSLHPAEPKGPCSPRSVFDAAVSGPAAHADVACAAQVVAADEKQAAGGKSGKKNAKAKKSAP